MPIRSEAWVYPVLLLAPFFTWAQTPPAALVPRTPTGFSNLEQRYAYAPPAEGEFEIPLSPGLANPVEVAIQEPIMCAGRATTRVRYSKSRNTVSVETEFHGLPYRMSYTRPVDVSTPYNRFPVSVENGKWQMWFVGRLYNLQTIFYYDPVTLQLIGNEADVPNPPPDAIAIKAPTLQMISSPLFEGTPSGEGHVRFEFKYDQLLDSLGTGGVYFAYMPHNLCKPDEYGMYYTQGGLSTSRAMSFDDVLQAIHSGYGMAVAFSLEPDPKPEYLAARDNPMVGWSGGYPAVTPPGMDINPIDGTFRVQEQCATHINRGFAQGYYNLCMGK